MQFFLGFMTATIIFTIILCLSVFFNEENKKRRRSNIIPGHEFFVHRIGEIKVQSIHKEEITYTNSEGETFSTDIEIFTQMSPIPLDASRRVDPKPKKKTQHRFYNKRGTIYDV